MTQRAALRIGAVLSFFPLFLVACSASDNAPATTGSGGASGTGGAASGSGGQGTGGQGTGGSDPAGSGGSVAGSGGAGTEAGVEAGGDSPANPDSGITDPGKEGDGRFNIDKPPTPPEAAGRLAGVTAGMSRTVQVAAAMGFTGRSVTVYVPSGYVAGTPVAFLICHDGQDRPAAFNLPVIMDNLIFEKKIPMMVGIFIPNSGARSVEYDTVNDKFSQWVTTQVLPAVATLNIKLTIDPEASAVMGHSSGGILAFTQAWFEPERYRRVLSLSGSFLSLQNPGGGLYDNLVRTTMPLKPIRIAMSAGTNDLNAPAWTKANETMGAALVAAGYHVRYLLINGGTHTPFEVNRPWIPDLLTWLWRGYPISGPTR
jgi:enterochelin esterase-like enzyme